MNTSGIELELQEVSDVKQKKREDRQVYLTRLMQEVSKVPDDIWDSLSEDAREWNNEAATAFKEEREIDDFVDGEEDPVEEETNVEASEPDGEPIPSQEEMVTWEDVEKEEPDTDEGPSDAWKAQDAKIEPEPVRRRGRPPNSSKVPEPEHQEGMKTKVRGKNTSACHKIKRMVVKKPFITVDEIISKLKAEGLKVTPVTVATLRSSTRDTLRVLNEEGLGTFKMTNVNSAD